jgi:hypothetical protein
VRYENLAADPVGVMTGVFQSVGLPVNDALLDAVTRLAPQPVNRSYGLGASTSTWRDDLSADQVAAVEQVAADLLDELGYQRVSRPPTLDRPRRRRMVGSRRRSPTGSAPAAQPSVVSAPAPISLTEPDRLPSVRGDERQWVIDRFLAALSDGDVEWIAATMSPRAEIRLHGAGSGGDRFGPEADPRAAAQALVDHARPAGRQVRGDLYAAHPAHTIVWTHEVDGLLSHGVLVVTIDRDDTLLALDSYRMTAPE